MLRVWKRETERSACESGSAKLHFQHCLSSNIASVCSFWWNLTMTIVPNARLPTIAHVLHEIPLRSTARRSLLIPPHTEPRQTEANHILAPTICTPHFSHNQKPASVCVYVCARMQVCVWLSAMSRRSHHCGFLWIHNNPSITETASSTFLTLCLRNISAGRIYFQGVPSS